MASKSNLNHHHSTFRTGVMDNQSVLFVL